VFAESNQTIYKSLERKLDWSRVSFRQEHNSVLLLSPILGSALGSNDLIKMKINLSLVYGSTDTKGITLRQVVYQLDYVAQYDGSSQYE
jgi:hypothetical protein